MICDWLARDDGMAPLLGCDVPADPQTGGTNRAAGMTGPISPGPNVAAESGEQAGIALFY
jgi:hypothetical protein